MIIFSLLIFILFYPEVNGNQDAKRLYDDLFKSYNILVRPVENSSDFITVKLGLKLVKIIELVCNFRTFTNFHCFHSFFFSKISYFKLQNS